jgi:hypothetical protein
MQVSVKKDQPDRSGTISVGGAQIACNLYLKKYDVLIFFKRKEYIEMHHITKSYL